MTDLEPDDAKLVILARASMARIDAKEGAAVRDLDGRSYAAGPVKLPSLAIGALELAVAEAVSAGATGLEAAAIVTAREDPVINLGVVRDLAGEGIPVVVADARGDVQQVLTS